MGGGVTPASVASGLMCPMVAKFFLDPGIGPGSRPLVQAAWIMAGVIGDCSKLWEPLHRSPLRGGGATLFGSLCLSSFY